MLFSYSNEIDDFICILDGLMIKIDEEDFELMATIARSISFCRNTVVVGRELMHPSRTTKKTVFSVVFE